MYIGANVQKGSENNEKLTLVQHTCLLKDMFLRLSVFVCHPRKNRLLPPRGFLASNGGRIGIPIRPRMYGSYCKANPQLRSRWGSHRCTRDHVNILIADMHLAQPLCRPELCGGVRFVSSLGLGVAVLLLCVLLL